MKQTYVLAGSALAVGAVLYMPVVLFLLFGGVVFGAFLHAASHYLARRIGMPRKLALTLLVVAILLLLGALLAAMVPRILSQFEELGRNLPAYIRQAGETLRGLDLGWPALNQAADQLAAVMTQLPESLVAHGLSLFSRVAGILSTSLGALGVLLIVFAVAVYIAVEPGLYQRGVLFLVPGKWHAAARRIMAQTSRAVAWWFVGQAISIAILFTITAAGLWLIGVPFALMFGVFTGLMTFIPSLGPVIAAVPTLLVALTQGVPEVLATLGLLIVLQNLEGLFITPNIHRRIIHLPPALVLAAVLVLGKLVGAIGMFMAMPLVVVSLTIAQGVKAEWQAEKAPAGGSYG